MKSLFNLLVLLAFFDGMFSASDSTDLRHILKALEFVDRYPSFLNCADIYLPNGRAKLRSNGRVVRFNCKSGYQLLGKQFSTCIRGRWNTPTPVCVAKGCRELRPPVNGMMRKVDREGAVYTFACEPGYQLFGSMGLFCNRLLWNATIPTCAPEVTNASYSCDFESPELCNWRHETRRDNFDWSMTSSKTPSGYWGTGPSYDHTLGTNRSGQYMYIEASSPRKENDNAILVSPVYNQDGYISSLNDVMCVHLWYHMYGSSTGSLKIHLKQDGIYTQLWNASGNHGDQWLLAVAPVDVNPVKTFQIAIEAVRGTGYAGDIAVDDFSIQFGDNCTVEIETDVTWTTDSTTSTDYAMEISTSGIEDASTATADDAVAGTVLTTKQIDESTFNTATFADLPTPLPSTKQTSIIETAKVFTTTFKTWPTALPTNIYTLTSINTLFTRPTMPIKSTSETTTKPTTITQPTITTTTTIATTAEPITTTAKQTTIPTTMTIKQVTTTTKPTTITTKPTTVTTEQTTTTNKPTTVATKPTTVTTEQTTITTKPTTTKTTSSIKTTTKLTTRVAPTFKPNTTTIKPITTTIKPTIATSKPTTATTKLPATSAIKSTTASVLATTIKKLLTKGPSVITTINPTPKIKPTTTLRTTTRRTYKPTFKPFTKPTSTKKPIFPITKATTKVFTKPTTIKTTTTAPTISTETWTTVDVGKKPVLPPWVYLRTSTIDPNDLDNDLRPLAQTAHSSVGVPAAIGITVVTVVVLLIALIFHVYRKYAKRQKDNLQEDSDVRFLKDGEMHVEFIDHDVMHPISFT